MSSLVFFPSPADCLNRNQCFNLVFFGAFFHLSDAWNEIVTRLHTKSFLSALFLLAFHSNAHKTFTIIAQMKNNAVIKSWSLIKADRANQYKMKIHFLYSQIKRILTDTILLSSDDLSSVNRSSTLFHKLRLKAKRFEQNKRAYIWIAKWRFYSCLRLRWHIYNNVRFSFIITMVFATFISTCICVRVFEYAILSSELVNWILPQKLPLTLWFHWEWFMRLFSADNEQRFIVIVVIFRKVLRVFFSRSLVHCFPVSFSLAWNSYAIISHVWLRHLS